jgi:hypothetical protein
MKMPMAEGGQVTRAFSIARLARIRSALSNPLFALDRVVELLQQLGALAGQWRVTLAPIVVDTGAAFDLRQVGGIPARRALEQRRILARFGQHRRDCLVCFARTRSEAEGTVPLTARGHAAFARLTFLQKRPLAHNQADRVIHMPAQLRITGEASNVALQSIEHGRVSELPCVNRILGTDWRTI